MIDFASQTVLVTGASSGIGREFADALADRGSALVLVARRADRLHELADRLSAQHSVQVVPLAADLSEPTGPTRLHEALDAQGVQVTSLVNAAGFGTWGPFLEEDAARVEQEIALDVSAPVRLAGTFLPDLVRAGNGFFVNVASMAAYTPTPRMAVYGAARPSCSASPSPSGPSFAARG